MNIVRILNNVEKNHQLSAASAWQVHLDGFYFSFFVIAVNKIQKP